MVMAVTSGFIRAEIVTRLGGATIELEKTRDCDVIVRLPHGELYLQTEDLREIAEHLNEVAQRLERDYA